MNIQFEQVILRLKKALRIRSDKEVGAALGMTPSALSNRKQTGSIPYDQIIELASSRKLNLNWIFLGSGNPFEDTSEELPPFDLEGTKVDGALLGLILASIEDEYLRSKDQDHTGLVFWQSVQGVLHEQKDRPPSEVNKTLFRLLEEEAKRRVLDARDKGVIAAPIYNELAAISTGKSEQKLIAALKKEVPKYVSILKQIKSKSS
jgi:hypothetical protein